MPKVVVFLFALVLSACKKKDKEKVLTFSEVDLIRIQIHISKITKGPTSTVDINGLLTLSGVTLTGFECILKMSFCCFLVGCSSTVYNVDRFFCIFT